MTEDFIQKLMISKQIMEKSDRIARNTNGTGALNISENATMQVPELYSANPVNASYNIPQELLQETKKEFKPPVVTEDRIMNSKLPEAIKKLMIEHPIQKPDSYTPTISNDIIERAARLMNENKEINQSSKQTNTSYTQNKSSDLKSVIRETMEEILKEYGILNESEQKTKDQFQFRVGKHVFEGTISKVKKLR